MGLAINDRKERIERLIEFIKSENEKEMKLDSFLNKIMGVFPHNQLKRFMDYLKVIESQGIIIIDEKNNKITKNE